MFNFKACVFLPYVNVLWVSSFTNKYLVTIPDLPRLMPQGKKIMKIRNLRAALDPSVPVDCISLQICTLVGKYVPYIFFISQ